jgi:peroxin-7
MSAPGPASGMLHTSGFAHYSLAWSPFHSNRLAIASSANYGLIGNGRLHLTTIIPGPGAQPDVRLEKLYATIAYLLAYNA